MVSKGPKMKTEKVKVSIETCCRTIIGTVHPPSLAYRSRLSDLLNQKDLAFLSVTDAEVYQTGHSEKPLFTSEYLAVNLEKIEIIRPLEE